MGNIKKRLTMLLAAVLIITTALPMTVWADTTWKEALEDTDDYIETHQSSEDWSNFAMARKLNSDLTESKFVEYGEKIENTDFAEKDAAGYTTALLALESIGRGESAKSEELTKKLMTYDSSDTFFMYASEQTKANMLQSLQGQVDLNTGTYQENKVEIDSAIAALKTDLVASKESDGNYWMSWGNRDIDTTAAIADALSRYSDTGSLASGASDWLISEKAADNGYGYSYDWNTFTIDGAKTNVNSTAMALIALADNNKDTAADAAVVAMMEHYLGSGAFEYDIDTYGTKVPNDMATEQADYALVAYERSTTAGATSLFDFSDVTTVYYFTFDGNGASNTMSTQAIESGDTKNLNASTLTKNGYKFMGWKDADGNTYTDAQAVTASKDVELYAVWAKKSSSGSSGGGSAATAIKVSNIAEKMQVKTQDALNGTWKRNEATGNWTLTVDGQLIKNGWALAFNPYAGSGVASWFYFDENGNMLTGWQLIPGTDGSKKWYYLNPVINGWLGACYMNAVTPDGYTVDATGAWVDTNETKTETTQQVAEKTENQSSGTSSGSESASGKKISISVSVSGNTVSGSETVTVKKNASVYDALKALAKEMGWSISGSSSYVKGIGGEMEKSAGALSGWTYSVNGETPNKSAGSYKLKDGDDIEWVFVDGPEY